MEPQAYNFMEEVEVIALDFHMQDFIILIKGSNRIISILCRKLLLWNFRSGARVRLRPFGIRLNVEHKAAPSTAGTEPRDEPYLDPYSHRHATRVLAKRDV